MRYVFGFLCVCALGAMPVVGCSETTGDGGGGGAAGDGGSGGTAGTGGSGGNGCIALPVGCEDGPLESNDLFEPGLTYTGSLTGFCSASELQCCGDFSDVYEPVGSEVPLQIRLTLTWTGGGELSLDVVAENCGFLVEGVSGTSPLVFEFEAAAFQLWSPWLLTLAGSATDIDYTIEGIIEEQP